MFPLPKGKPEFSKLEEAILQKWKSEKTFERSVESRSANNPYRFYDGPPFITGMPHYGSLLSSIIKDVVPRYQTMLGKRVERVWGWDCHGLPIEQKVQKKLGLESNKAIEESPGGIQHFIDECYNYTQETSSDWNWYIDHIGRWVDMENAYRTMDQDYMESVMWVFKQTWEKGYVYEGKRVSWYSWKLSTPISNFEIAMDDSYQDVQDAAITVKFPLKNPEKIGLPQSAFFLAWTTTPWTIPMHMALAVNSELEYVAVVSEGTTYILASSRVEIVFKGKGKYEVTKTFSGKELLGLSYEAPFDFYSHTEGTEKSFLVYHADFVTDTDGTGIAHEAPEFGDVDFQLAKEKGINITSAIDEAGKYTAEIPDYQGQLYLDCNDSISERLKAEGKLFKKESITHRVPYCPRSNTPLMQRAQKSWFIDIQRIKGELIEQNEHINWFPDHFKHGRFLKSLETAPDWCISRSRFWGTPMPIWQNEDGSERVVIGSREELYQKNKPLKQITKVITLRHAQSEANVSEVYDDVGESDLSEKGYQQAKELVEKLAQEGIDVIISSPFARTLQTVEPLAKKLGITIRTIDTLREINHGVCANTRNSDESRKSRDAFRADPTVKFGETGESQDDVRNRMKEVVDIISNEYQGKTVLVVTHGFPAQGFLEAMGREKLPQKYPNGEYWTTYIGTDGQEINLHRPKIDNIYLPSQNIQITKDKIQNEGSVSETGNSKLETQNLLKRIPEVLDVWMDSASMPYAQGHYPFENIEKMEASFPADFIAEYTGQIRAWFYVMHAIGVMVKGSPAFKNVAVTGVINGTDGRKMSKSFGNYPDPKVTIEQYGADALRFYLMGGPIMRGEDMNFSETGIAESLKKVLIPLWNSYTFFATYANIDGWKPDGTEIWFTRHAESQKNVEKRMSGGEDDSPLSSRGHEQVGALLEQIHVEKPFDVVIASPRKRVIDTISGLGDYIIDERFLEQNSGEFSGLTYEEIYAKIGVRDVSAMRKAYRWNSVEPWDQFYQRVSGALDDVISQNKGKKILIAAHAGTFRACTQYFYNLKDEDVFYGEGIKNACLYQFPKTPKTHELDVWILSQLHNLVSDTRKHMDNYDTQKACDGFVTFLDGLNNWYIRRNRRRFWRKEVDADKCSAYETLHEVLTTVCQILAPICPFLTETLFGYLHGDKDSSSVHLTYFPSAQPLILHLTVNEKMKHLQNLTNLGLAIRGREKLRVRQPLRKAFVTLDLDASAQEILEEELNVKEIEIITDIYQYVTITYSPDAKKIGATPRREWMKTIISEAKSGKGNITLEGGLEITCPEAPEGKILLSPDEFEMIYTPMAGSHISFAGNAGYVIGLDTVLDEELTQEGYARDLIRAIQDTRKEFGFEVTDRLQLSLTSEDPILTKILFAHSSLIESETLCKLSGSVISENKIFELDTDIQVNIQLVK